MAIIKVPFPISGIKFNSSGIMRNKPERTTASFISRPFEVNFEMMFSKGSKGDGSCWLAALSLAVRPSRRPKAAGQSGPPACNYRIKRRMR